MIQAKPMVVWFALLMLCVAGPAWAAAPAASPVGKRALIVAAYPAQDAQLFRFAFKRQGAKADLLEKTWVDVKDWAGKYQAVVLTGGFERATTSPYLRLTVEDLKQLRRYLDSGGTLVMTRGTFTLFGTSEGQSFLTELFGWGRTERNPELKLMEPNHPWVKHLANQDLSWLTENATHLRAVRGQRLIGNETESAVLYRLPVGRGQLVYIGWELTRFLPKGRDPKAAVQDEERYESQVQILFNIVGELYPGQQGQ